MSLLWDKRAIPLDWQRLPKLGSSHLAEQKALWPPGLRWLQHHSISLTAERECHRVKLATWLVDKRVLLALPQTKGTDMQQPGQTFQRLETLGLKPGV